MVRTKEDGTVTSDENVSKIIPIKSASNVKMRTKSDKEQVINIDKSSFGIGFFISACVFIMFMVGCIVGSNVM